MSIGTISKSTPVQLSLVIGLLMGAFQAGIGWNRLLSVEARMEQNERNEKAWQEETVAALKAITAQCTDHEFRLRLHEQNYRSASQK